MVRIRVSVRVLMRVLMRELMRVLMRMNRAIRVRMFVAVIGVRYVFVLMIVAVGVFMPARLAGLLIRVDDDVNLRSRDSAASHLAHFEARTHVQGRSGLLEQGERNAGVHQRAEQHVAADAGEAIEIGNSHRENCNYAPRRISTSAGSTAFNEPDRKPVQSSVTYWKPALRKAAEI